MDFSSILDAIEAAWADASTYFVDSPEIAGVGPALIVGAFGAAIILIIRGVDRIVSNARRVARDAAIRRSSDLGARIIVVRGRSGRQRALSKFATEALSKHLADYMFGGQFRIIDYPGGLSGDADATALLSHTETDVVLWPETVRGSRVLHIASRPSSPIEKPRAPRALVMPKERAAWASALARGVAYAAAKAFRPALGRPQDFRSDRLRPVVESLAEVLAASPKADPALLAEMLDDMSAGALQLAFTGEPDWSERAVEVARSTLAEIDRGAAPDRWVAAKITLGRALRLRCEKRFDPVLLQEAVGHLTEALEALRAEPRFKLAEAAAQAISDAQKMLSARRRFSISGAGL